MGMTPMDAWHIISANLAHLVKIKRSQGDPKGFVPADTEAEVFAFQALKQMQERMYPQPLDVAEIQQMQDEPVWVEHLENPAVSGWGVVESISTIGKDTTMYLWGQMGCIEVTEKVNVYRYKPEKTMEHQQTPQLLFSHRRKLAAIYRKWCKQNRVDVRLETMIAFLRINGLINIRKTLDFIEWNKEDDAGV